MSIYGIISWVVFSVFMLWLLLYFVYDIKWWQGSKTVIVVLALLGLFIGFSIGDTLEQGNIERQETCNAYCECQETQDCNYTFDYNDIKSCECK